MYKLNLIEFYRLGTELAALRSRPKDEELPVETYDRLFSPARWLGRLLVDINFVPARKARAAATELQEYLEQIRDEAHARISDPSAEQEDTLVAFAHMQMLLTKFERELERESQEANVFAVWPKGTHSTAKLLDHAELNIPYEVRTRLRSEVIEDIRAAGRCLGFDTPTAAAFHILRAVEPLILQYRNALVGSELRSKSRNWGAYIKDLNNHNGDPRVIGMIGHIKDFYRNPIMHPEVTITPDQALSLFHTSLSAIVQLDAAIQVVSPTPAKPE